MFADLLPLLCFVSVVVIARNLFEAMIESRELKHVEARRHAEIHGRDTAGRASAAMYAGELPAFQIPNRSPFTSAKGASHSALPSAQRR